MSAPLVLPTMGTILSLTFPAEVALTWEQRSHTGPARVAGRLVPTTGSLSVELQAIVDGYDERFSLYQPGSELSRLNRHELLLREASLELKQAYALADDWRLATDGAFTAHRPDGVIDLSGVVKALAMQAVADHLAARGLGDWCLNLGGDVLVAGLDGDQPWRTGIVDPRDRGQLLSQFDAGGELPAVATSGIAERGEHVWRVGAPGWSAGTDPYVQVTVCGPDIVTADVLATAVLAGGPETAARACREHPLELLAITRSGQLFATDAFAA